MLTYYFPLLVFVLSIPVILITLFKVEIGILYFITFIPVIVLTKKIALFPLGNQFADFLIISLVLGSVYKSLKEKRGIFESSPINIVVILVILGSILSLIWGYLSNELGDDVNWVRLATLKNFMILPVLYFVSANSVHKEKLVKWIIFCNCITLLAMDFNFYSTFRWMKGEHYSHSLRVSGPLGYLGPNELGIFYAMYTFLLLGISYFLENKKLKYFVLFVCACNLYPILYSYSRSGYICALVGMLTLGILKDRKWLILLCVLIVSYGFILPQTVVERIDNTFLDKEEISEELRDQSVFEVGGVEIEVTGRKQLWAKAMEYFKEDPVLGIGFDVFRQKEGWITHSLFLEILAEQGLIGAAIFFAFFAMLIHQSMKLFKTSRSKLSQGVGLGFFTTLVVFLSGSITGGTFLYYNMMAIFWLFMGIVASLNTDAGHPRGRLDSFDNKGPSADRLV